MYVLLKTYNNIANCCHKLFAGNIQNWPFVNNTDINLTRSFSSVTLLEGDTFTLSCTPSIMDVVVLWTQNEIQVLQRRDVRFSPSNLNHTLTIRNAKECDSGIYSCFGITGNGSVLAEQSTTVNVLLGMNFYVES